MSNTFIFSTGRLYLTPPGGTETELALLHNTTVTAGAKKKDLEAPPAFSLYPVAVGFYEAECTMTAEVCSFNPDAIAAIVAGASGANNGSGGVQQTTIVDFQTMVLRFDFTDTNGVAKEAVFPSVLAPNLSLQFGSQDFLRKNTTFIAYPDANANVLTIDVGA
jgi:hypothetical protein